MIEKMRAFSKGELHVHLNGLISSNTIKAIISDENIQIPVGFDLERDLISISARSLQQYLKPWEILRLLPRKREGLRFLLENAFENLKKENVQFAEIRNSILYLSHLNEISVSTAISWLLEDLQQVSEKHKIEFGLIMTVSRSKSSLEDLRTLISAYKAVGKPRKVVGLDLAGDEDVSISGHLGEEFERAKGNFGLGITIHAGETGNKNNVRTAIQVFKADRIGHGIAAADCPETMEMLKEMDICVEVCPISNRLTRKDVNEGRRAIQKFIENGVPFVICSDNPGIQQSSISQDYLEIFEQTANLELIGAMYEMQKKYTFLKNEK